MSNSIATRRNGYRVRLLTGVSAMALLGFIYSAGRADAAGNDGDRPPLWVELGFHYDRLNGLGDAFAPPFVLTSPWAADDLTSPLQVQNRIVTSTYGIDGKISFEPNDSDWIYSASVRFGRGHSAQHVHQQRPLPGYHATVFGQPYTFHPLADKFGDTVVKNKEAHAIIDFQAGKDVGLGTLGKATFELGVRFAQFNTRESPNVYARAAVDVRPFNFPPYIYNLPNKYWHNYAAYGQAERNFSGVGPSISWSGETPFAGNPQDGELTLDWGVNAALLFGRQKTKVQHHTVDIYYDAKYGYYSSPGGAAIYGRGYHKPVRHNADIARRKNVLVPNIGGFAGLSYQWSEAKLSIGYRADFFLNAIDGGWDIHKDTARGFYGPFASISIGLGN